MPNGIMLDSSATDVAALKKFYCQILGFTLLHDVSKFNEAGKLTKQQITLCHPELSHSLFLRFNIVPTSSVVESSPEHLIIFYLNNAVEFERYKSVLIQNGCQTVQAFNPWWDAKGITFLGPDKQRIVFWPEPYVKDGAVYRARIGRPSGDVNKLKEHYITEHRLELISEFDNHQGFDGVILAPPESDCQVEFTHCHKHHFPKASQYDMSLISEADFSACKNGKDPDEHMVTYLQGSPFNQLCLEAMRLRRTPDHNKQALDVVREVRYGSRC